MDTSLLMRFEIEQFGPVEPIPLIVGALFLFAGWALYWASLNLTGAAVGGGLGLLAAEVLRELFDLQDVALLLVRICGTLLGVIIGIAVVGFLHRTAFFLTGLVLGGAACFFIVTGWRAHGAPEWVESDLAYAIGIPVAGVLGGILSVVWNKFLIALATATIGAILVQIGIVWKWGVLPVPPLAVLGFGVQVWLTRKKRRKREEE